MPSAAQRAANQNQDAGRAATGKPQHVRLKPAVMDDLETIAAHAGEPTKAGMIARLITDYKKRHKI